jgi:hypothetical protein
MKKSMGVAIILMSWILSGWTQPSPPAKPQGPPAWAPARRPLGPPPQPTQRLGVFQRPPPSMINRPTGLPWPSYPVTWRNSTALLSPPAGAYLTYQGRQYSTALGWGQMSQYRPAMTPCPTLRPVPPLGSIRQYPPPPPYPLWRPYPSSGPYAPVQSPARQVVRVIVP